MKALFKLLVFFTFLDFSGQIAAQSEPQKKDKPDTVSSKVIFFDDFNDNKNNWSIGDSKTTSTKMDGGIYYLRSLGHASGEGQEVKINSRKNFLIEARIRIVDGGAEHKNYYSMLFWGREGTIGHYFTFAKDGFASVELCDGKNQSSCIVRSGSLQKTTLNPDEFNVYRVEKKGNVYSFFINGIEFYQMPFAPFFGNLIGFGAGRKATLAIDYLKVMYL